MRRKIFALFFTLAGCVGMSWATIPIGSVDGVEGGNGSFRIWGWTIDQDAPSQTIEVHVYLYKVGTNEAVKGFPGTYANISRPDLNNGDPNSYGYKYGTNHGYDRWISIIGQVNPGTYDVRVWAINVNSSEGNHVLGYTAGGEAKTITIGDPYTVSYNANSGTGAPGTQEKAQYINLTLSSTTPTRTGYTFNGWNTASNGSGTNYAKGATYSANASTTLYAKWTANKYTVTLDKQNGTGGSNSVTATYDANMPSATMPTRTGYTFQGYYDATSDGTKYYNADGSSARTWNKAANTTLYARWTANQYTITFNNYDGTALQSGLVNYGETPSYAGTPSKPSTDAYVYTFTGWSPAIAAVTGDATYTAQFSEQPNQATVDHVVALINAIGEVAYTDEYKAKIDAARTAYDALTDAQKALVGNNYSTLTASESAFAAYMTPADVTANLDPDNEGVYYSTYYDGTRRFTVPAGVEAFVAKLDGTDLVLTRIATVGQVLPNATGVILRADAGAFVLTPTLEAGESFDAEDNCLLGKDAPEGAPDNCYVISGRSADNSVVGVGFYRYTGELKAHKAYTIYNVGSGNHAPKRMRFVFNQENTATGVEKVSAQIGGYEKVLENGVIYIVRDGVKYNAQGQIVK